jgi:hypothetical protein
MYLSVILKESLIMLISFMINDIKMKKMFIASALVILICFSISSQEIRWTGPSVDLNHGNLVVSANGRYLEFEDGTPFLYIGDTAWELFHRLNREEAEKYLEKRREQGFTVVQAVVLAELDGLNTPNAYGGKPLIGNDPLKPNEKYFQHVDDIVSLAAEKGIFIGMLPAWGDKVDPQWGRGPVIFNPDNAYAYGQWIGKRYKDEHNIIWINGGDRWCGDQNYKIWNALGKGIKSVDPNHLMTFHPHGGISSSWCLHEADWLDFNMLQSGHSDRYIPNYRAVEADYNLTPVKPCMDGEPNYEDHAINWNPENGWFDDWDVRRSSYWGVFAGGHGITYGCHPVWQFYDEGRDPITSARHYWYEVLELPGAWDMIHLRKLLESRPVEGRVPDQSLIVSDNSDGASHIRAMSGEGYALVYLPGNVNVRVRVHKIQANQVKAWWYNPRTGKVSDIGFFEGRPDKTFEVPVKGVDWVLVIDDVDMNYPEPGK